MSQSTALFLAFCIAFFIFVTVRGELKQYMAALF